MDRVQKIIAHAGICSRRDAEEMIKKGIVRVNGEQIEIGATADPKKDTIEVGGDVIKPEKSVYIMVNKPKGYVTTTDDPWDRKNVMQLVKVKQRIYPVGRLDKDVKGLLLMTNDGDFANKVMHPRYEMDKTYEATLDKPVEQKDIDRINKGVTIDNRHIKADATRLGKVKVRITVHVGMNKIVKRIFKECGYWVKDLERVQIGDVKLDIKEGHFRMLNQKEVNSLH